MKHTLFVIDMQDYFLTSWSDAERKELVRAVRAQMRESMYAFQPIVLVEYTGCGRTTDELFDIVDEYSHVHILRKHTNGGGTKLAQYVAKHNLPEAIKIVGINTDFCVLESVTGLVEQLPTAKVEVISKACDSPYDHRGGLRQLRKLANVNVV